VLIEVVDQGARVDTKTHRDDRLNVAPDGGEVDLGVKASQDPPRDQPADPFQAGRGGDPDPRRELLVGNPRIALQFDDEGVIDSVHVSRTPGSAESYSDFLQSGEIGVTVLICASPTPPLHATRKGFLR
jgi:hypothetical protein